MATTTDPRYSSALATSAKRVLELMCAGDDDLRDAFMNTAVLKVAGRFIESDGCSRLEVEDHNEFHDQYDILARYVEESQSYWCLLLSSTLQPPT